MTLVEQSTLACLQGRIGAEAWRAVEADLARFTPEQLAVVEALLDTPEHLVVSSTAGSGKSTLLRVLANLLPAGVNAVLAFNVSIAEEIAPSMPQGVLVTPLHKLGHKLLRSGREGALTVVPFKRRNLVRAYLAAEALPVGLTNGLTRLSERALTELTPATEEALRALALQLDLLIPAGLSLLDLVRAVSEASVRQYHDAGVVDFTDLLYLPIKLGLGKGMLDHALVDEAQDLSRLQLRFVRHLAGKAGRLVLVGDEAQCQPRGTMVSVIRAPKDRWHDRKVEQVPIESLTAGDSIVGFDPRSSAFALNRRVVAVSERPFQGELVTVSTASQHSRYTPDHRCYASFEPLRGQYALYLMRQGRRARIGIASMDYGRASGPIKRARSEDADQLWILATYPTRAEALLAESAVCAQYGLPGLTFRCSTSGAVHFTAPALERTWTRLERTVDLVARGEDCLRAHGRDPASALWNRRNPYLSLKRPMVVRACNLLTGCLMVPFDEQGDVHIRRAEWTTVVVGRELYVGPVYSLEVSHNHLYVADGLVTHNCLYGFSGADVGGLSKAVAALPARLLHLTVTFRCPASHVRIAQRFSSHIQAAPDAPEGEVRTLDLETALASCQPGDLVMARLNAPIVGFALRLAERGVPVTVLGHDLERLVADTAREALPESFAAGEVEALMLAHATARLDAFIQKGLRGQVLARAVQAEEDRLACVAALAVQAARGGEARAADVGALLKALSSEQGRAVRLCTVHRAKGLEAERALLLQPDELLGAQDDAERPVAFVALTRARDALWFVQPGGA